MSAERSRRMKCKRMGCHSDSSGTQLPHSTGTRQSRYQYIKKICQATRSLQAHPPWDLRKRGPSECQGLKAPKQRLPLGQGPEVFKQLILNIIEFDEICINVCCSHLYDPGDRIWTLTSLLPSSGMPRHPSAMLTWAGFVACQGDGKKTSSIFILRVFAALVEWNCSTPLLLMLFALQYHLWHYCLTAIQIVQADASAAQRSSPWTPAECHGASGDAVSKSMACLQHEGESLPTESVLYIYKQLIILFILQTENKNRHLWHRLFFILLKRA